MTDSKNNVINSELHAGRDIRIGDDYITYNNYFAAQEVKIPPRLTNNIPTNADHILGRAAELAQAHNHLAQHQATVLFNGIGGIGKTALASKYMAIYGNDYKHLAWITVQSTLAEAFTNNAPLLASLQITQQVQDYIAAKQLDKAFEYLFHQLNLLEHTLVVIDNANDLDDLDQYKNWFDTANCHFLITSRSQPSEWATVEVDSLPEDEAVRLFRKLHPSVSADDEAIKSLLSKLFYHTLLIELVAKAGASTGITFADLQSMIETKFIHHQSLNEAPIPTGKHGSVVTTNLKKAKIEDYIWLIFSQVKGLNDESKHLLKAMALLPIATPFDLDFLKEHFAFFNIPNAVVHLDALIEQGWLQKEQAEGQKPYFKMHPLIGDVVVDNLRVDAVFAEKYIWRTALLIDYNDSTPEYDIFLKNIDKPLAERLSDLFFTINSDSICFLLDRIGSLERYSGFYYKNAKYRERALQIAENLFDTNHIMVASCQNNLGQSYQYLGKYKESSKLLEQALAKFLKICDKDDQLVTSCQSNLANVYQDLGKYDKAIELLETAVASDVKNFGYGHPVLAKKLANLGDAYRAVGQNAIAITLLEAALSTNLKNFNKTHSSVAGCQSNLALAYRELGQYDCAIELLETALASVVENFGNDHPTVAVYQTNLGSVYEYLGKNDRVIQLYEMALENGLKNLDIKNPTIAIRQNNLASIYYVIGRNIEAKHLWQAAYQNYLENFGATHQYTVHFKQCADM